jgi:hypothetical protein
VEIQYLLWVSILTYSHQFSFQQLLTPHHHHSHGYPLWISNGSRIRALLRGTAVWKSSRLITGRARAGADGARRETPSWRHQPGSKHLPEFAQVFSNEILKQTQSQDEVEDHIPPLELAPITVAASVILPADVPLTLSVAPLVATLRPAKNRRRVVEVCPTSQPHSNFQNERTSVHPLQILTIYRRAPRMRQYEWPGRRLRVG